MCGACRCLVDGKTKFACVDGPEFDGHLVDWDSAMSRSKQYIDNFKTKELSEHKNNLDGLNVTDANLENKKINDVKIEKAKDRWKRTPIAEQDPNVRNKNFDEVCLGYTPQEAVVEASRCLNCKVPGCVKGCPVSIDIPGFIKEIANANFEQSAKVLSMYTACLLYTSDAADDIALV